MSTSSPVRNRQPRRPSRLSQARSGRSGRDASVVARSILLVVAAVSVIGTSNYFAYMIGRKQVTAEELRKQIDRVVQLMDRKRVEEVLAPAAIKQRQDRLEQNAPALTGLTTSTINGKTTVVVPEPAPMAVTRIDDSAGARPPNEAGSQAPDSSLTTATIHPDVQGAARAPRRHKGPAKRGATEPAIAEQPATRDASVAGQ